MGLNGLFNKIRYMGSSLLQEEDEHEFCPRCEANLTLQKGYSNDLPYWICKGCGEMLINPAVDTDTDIVWRCDKCGSMLNIQQGFNEECKHWVCEECGYINGIEMDKVFTSDDEYQAYQRNPYKGLSDTEILRLSLYEDETYIDGRGDIILVSQIETKKLYVKKLITSYNKSVYEYLRDNPIEHMPRIYEVYESDNCLIVIEEYIRGNTLECVLNEATFSEEFALNIVKQTCRILDTLHKQPTPIIHRDIKPSNIIVMGNGEVYLLDMNVAKWYNPDKNDDTRYMGTQYYAAPEQFGYGFSSSSDKTDIYAVGILLNVMLTGKIPKEEKAEGVVWDIIERCISLEPENRYTATELIEAIDKIKEQ